MGRCKQLLNDMLVTGYVKIDLDAFVRQVPLADLSQFGKDASIRLLHPFGVSLDYPYLVCQAALFAGRFSRSLSAEVNRM
jgi:hypothetical protein